MSSWWDSVTSAAAAATSLVTSTATGKSDPSQLPTTNQQHRPGGGGDASAALFEIPIFDSLSQSSVFFPLSISPFLRSYCQTTGKTAYRLTNYDLQHVSMLLNLLSPPAGGGGASTSASSNSRTADSIRNSSATPSNNNSFASSGINNNSFGGLSGVSASVPQIVDSATLKQRLRTELEVAYTAPAHAAPHLVSRYFGVAGVACLFRIDFFSDAFATVIREKLFKAIHPASAGGGAVGGGGGAGVGNSGGTASGAPSPPSSPVAAAPSSGSGGDGPAGNHHHHHHHHPTSLYDMLKLPARVSHKDLRKAASRTRRALYQAIYCNQPAPQHRDIPDDEWDGTYRNLFPVGSVGCVSEVYQSADSLSTEVRSQPLARPRWENDDEITECRTCKKAFSAVWNRRSHCRCCGRIFCKTCLDPARTVATEDCAFPTDKNALMQKACVECFTSAGEGQKVRFLQDLIERFGFSIPETHILALIDNEWKEAATRVLRQYRESIYTGTPNSRHDAIVLATAEFACQHPQLLQRLARLKHLWDPRHEDYDRFRAMSVADQICGVLLDRAEPRSIFSHSQLACTRACNFSLSDRGTFAIQILAALNEMSGTIDENGTPNDPVIKIRKAAHLALVGDPSAAHQQQDRLPLGASRSSLSSSQLRHRSASSAVIAAEVSSPTPLSLATAETPHNQQLGASADPDDNDNAGSSCNNPRLARSPSVASSSSSGFVPSTGELVAPSPTDPSSSQHHHHQQYAQPLVATAPHSRVAVWLFALTDLLVETDIDPGSRDTIASIIQNTVRNEPGLLLRTFCEVRCREEFMSRWNAQDFKDIVTQEAGNKRQLNALDVFFTILIRVAGRKARTDAEAREALMAELQHANGNAPSMANLHHHHPRDHQSVSTPQSSPPPAPPAMGAGGGSSGAPPSPSASSVTSDYSVVSAATNTSVASPIAASHETPVGPESTTTAATAGGGGGPTSSGSASAVSGPSSTTTTIPLYRFASPVLYPFDFTGRTEIVAIDMQNVGVFPSNSKPVRIPLIVRDVGASSSSSAAHGGGGGGHHHHHHHHHHHQATGILPHERRASILLKTEDMWNDHLARQFAFILYDLMHDHLVSQRSRRGAAMPHLRGQMYSVLPIAKDCGIAEMLPDTVKPLQKVLALPAAQPPSLPSSSSPRGSGATAAASSASSSASGSSSSSSKAPSLRHFLLHESPTPDDSRRAIFCRSVQFSILLSHILGVADRHLSNVMLDVRSFALVDIDFGRMFGDRSWTEQIDLLGRNLFSFTSHADELTCARFDPMLAEAVVEMKVQAAILAKEKAGKEKEAKAAALLAAGSSNRNGVNRGGGSPTTAEAGFDVVPNSATSATTTEDEEKKLQKMREQALDDFIDETAKILFVGVRPWMDIISLLLTRHTRYFEQLSKPPPQQQQQQLSSTGGGSAGRKTPGDRDIIQQHFFHCFALTKKDSDAIDAFRRELKQARSRTVQDLAHTVGQQGAAGILSAGVNMVKSLASFVPFGGASANEASPAAPLPSSSSSAAGQPGVGGTWQQAQQQPKRS